MELNYELYKLKNGAKVLLIPDETTYSVTISAILNSSSALETEITQGITHFVEHLSVLANKSNPNREKLSKVREFNGAYVNASTSKETLKYFTNLPYTKLEFGLNDIYSTLYEATNNELLIEQERTTIIDEIQNGEDNPYQQQWQFIKETLITPVNGYTYDVAGTKETVSAFTRQDLLSHYNKAHKPNNLLLVLVGKFDVAKAKKLIDKLFSQQTSVPEDEIVFPNVNIKNNIVINKKYKKTDLVLSSLVIPTTITKTTTRDDLLKLIITNTLLGGPMSSRLKNRLREKEGILYNIQANKMINKAYGLIEIAFDTMPQNAVKALALVNEELNKFVETGITNEELLHYKEYIINRNLVQFDNIQSYANVIVNNVVANQDIITLEELIAQIKSYTLPEINEFIKKHYDLNKMSTLRFGNV